MITLEYKLNRKNAKVYTTLYEADQLFGLEYLIKNNRGQYQYLTIWFV